MTLFERQVKQYVPVAEEPLLLENNNAPMPLTLQEKEAAFKQAQSYIASRKLSQPQFVSKFGKPLSTLEFGDLCFIKGVKGSINEVVFSRDALTRPIVYCVSIVNVKNFCTSVEKSQEMRGLVDPWSIFTIPLDIVKEKFHNHRYYEQFMDLLGKEATQ